jgi:hypothetical protein
MGLAARRGRPPLALVCALAPATSCRTTLGCSLDDGGSGRWRPARDGGLARAPPRGRPRAPARWTGRRRRGSGVRIGRSVGRKDGRLVELQPRDGVLEHVEAAPERLELAAVRGVHRVQSSPPAWREPEAHEAVVAGVADALDEPRLGGAIDEADGAVVAKEKALGDVRDRRSRRILVAGDGQQKLVAGGGESGGDGLLLAPAQVAPEGGAELEELVKLCAVEAQGGRRKGIPLGRRRPRADDVLSYCDMRT